MGFEADMVLAIEFADHDKLERLASNNEASLTNRTTWIFCEDPVHCAAARGDVKSLDTLLSKRLTKTSEP